jgi:hypothetical protein
MKNVLLLSLFMSISLSINADFLKMSNDAEILDMESSEWSCVLDNKSSLVWEVKSENEGIQYALNTYTWFDGVSGRNNGTFSKNCYWGKGCNTQSYIEDINKAELCTYSDWRLPTRDELKSIVDYYGDSDILIDLLLFPNTQMDTYWTSMSAKDNPSLAYEIPFFFGGSLARGKTIDTFVRLVRSAD